MIDFHCHLDLHPEPRLVAGRAAEAGAHVLSVTTTPRVWRRTAALARDLPLTRTALGLHPQLAHERYPETALFEGLLDQTRYLGEVGLDRAPDRRAHADIQRKVFDRVLAAC